MWQIWVTIATAMIGITNPGMYKEYPPVPIVQPHEYTTFEQCNYERRLGIGIIIDSNMPEDIDKVIVTLKGVSSCQPVPGSDAALGNVTIEDPVVSNQ